MTRLARWTCRDGKRPTQVDGRSASSTNPETWTSYASVKDRPHGIMLGDGLACWDLDHCLNGDKLEPWAQAILDGCDPIWVERSQSGTGLHIFVEGEEGPGTRRGQVEYYSVGRFIAMTEFRYSPKRA